MPKSYRQHFHQNGSSFPFTGQDRARQGYAAIQFPAITLSRRLDALATDAQKVSRRECSQVGVLGDLERTRTRPLGEISFGQSLQSPGDPPEQLFPVPGSRYFPKYLSILLQQSRRACPAQAFDFH
jgi:hypothetical protein